MLSQKSIRYTIDFFKKSFFFASWWFKSTFFLDVAGVVVSIYHAQETGRPLLSILAWCWQSLTSWTGCLVLLPYILVPGISCATGGSWSMNRVQIMLYSPPQIVCFAWKCLLHVRCLAHGLGLVTLFRQGLGVSVIWRLDQRYLGDLPRSWHVHFPSWSFGPTKCEPHIKVSLDCRFLLSEAPSQPLASSIEQEALSPRCPCLLELTACLPLCSCPG